MPSVPLVPFENTPYSDPIFPGIPVPSDDPQSEPLVCLNYNANWQPILVALASRLTRYDAWIGDEGDQKLGVHKGHELIAMLQKEHCPEGIPEDICEEFLPMNPFTTYYPQNPFTQPGYIPNGYASPPFVTDTTNIIYGIVPTDVVVDLLSLPVDIIGFIAGGGQLPRIHIDLSGTGECELHFKKIAQGGFCTITIDGNPLTVKLVDLNAMSLLDIGSIFALLGLVFGGVFNQPHVHEIEFTTLGDHTIDITFFPNVGGTTILGFGGVFSGVNFCANSLSGDMNYMPITDMRVNTGTCKWEAEYNNDGMWVEIGDYYIPECSPASGGLIRDPGDGQLEQSLDGGDIWVDVPNAHFLHINADNDPLTGGLSIEGATDEIKLSIKGVGAPYQTQKLVVFKDANGVERTWVNPMGDMYVSPGPSPGNYSVEFGGRTLMSYLGGHFWRTSEGSLGKNNIVSNGADNLTFRSRAGYIWYDDTDAVVASVINGIYLFKNNASGGRTLYFIRSGAGQGTNTLLSVQDASGNPLNHFEADGRLNNFVRDAGTVNVTDNIVLDHESSAAPANGLGVGMRWRAKSSTTAAQEMARLYAVWSDATHATRKAQIVVSAYDTSEREVLRGGASGQSPAIGVLGATPAVRQDIGTVDCEGIEAAKSALDNLKLFGFIDGTINLGTAPTPETIINTGVQVPTLPTLDTQGAEALCSVARYLGEVFGNWLDWNIQISQFAADTRAYLDIVNLDAYLDNDLNFFESNMRIEWGVSLDLATSWYLGHETDMQSVIVGEGTVFGESEIVQNAIYAALRVTDTIFDENCLSLIQQYIGFIDHELSFPMADAIGIIPIWFWQRLVYIGLAGQETGCAELPPQEWTHTESWINDSWSGVTQTDGHWVNDIGYSTNAPGGLNRLEIPYSILEFTLTYSLGHGSGTPPAPPDLLIEDIATGEIVTIAQGDYGQYTETWQANIFPQGNQGVILSIQGSGNTTSAFKIFGVSGYGTEIPN